MPRKKTTRNHSGRSSIYFGKDGYWHGRVTMGIKDDGKPDRRHVMRKGDTAYDDVVEAVKNLEKQRDEGTARKPGRGMTVAEWLTYWVEEISAPTVRYRTSQGYRIDVYKHLIPRIGRHRMERIQHEPERFERVYQELIKAGNKPGMAHHVHRTARTAFREAKRRKVITEQPFDLVKPPLLEDEEVEPFEEAEIQLLIATAMKRRNGARFVLALALGTRKGETLNFKWSRLNQVTKVLRISKQRQRQTYEHGCADPALCAADRHKTEPCKKGCKRHKSCPPPCPPGCTGHARYCPERTGGVVEVDVKSNAGRRSLRLPDELYDLLMKHKEAQDKEREAAADLWVEGDFMFAQPDGRPIDPRSDHNEWKALLKEAGVRDARLHDARHTAATVLLLLGVTDRAVMDFMGWSNVSMLKRYQHVTAALRNDIASRVGGFLWSQSEL